MEVQPITKAQADKFVTQKHYSRRASMFQYAFALVQDGIIDGVVVFGSPPLMVQKHAFSKPTTVLELTRLVVQTKEKNAASILVGRALQMLPKGIAVVSYADTEMGHAGIIYQATNWVYTGATKSHDHMYVIDGKRVHPRTLAGRGISNPKQWAKENGIETIAPMQKHRYFFFTGSKSEKRELRKSLKYPIINEYPKLPKSMYDDGPEIVLTLDDRTAQGAMLF